MYRLGYLGPRGTFSEEAARHHLEERDGEAIACPGIETVLQGVDDGILEAGVVPVENSSEGAVGVVLDLLAARFNLAVQEEIILPINQCLMARSGVGLKHLQRVISHPQALAQCREFLSRRLPGVEWEEAASTAAAAALVARSNRPWAALGCSRSAGEFGLKILVPVANDCPNNVTRFWILGKKRLPREAASGGKTSLVFEVRDRPGALYDILGEFARRGINLTRIESRPARRRLGDYLFFVDLSGGEDDPPVRMALERIAGLTVSLKILGSYPVVDLAFRPIAGRRGAGRRFLTPSPRL